MKKTIIIIACIFALVVAGAAIAEVVQHSGKRGVSGKLGDTNRVWNELHIQDIIMEGATSDAYETTLSITDPAADRTFNLTATKRIPVNLCSVFVDASGPITAATAPNVATADNVGAITWDNSGETAEIQFNWSPSANYVSGMQIEVVMSSSTADGTDVALDWSVFVHDSAATFGTAIAQTSVGATGASLDASTEVVTLTLNSTGEAAVTAGTSVVTIALWNSAVAGSTGSTEIKAITILEL